MSSFEREMSAAVKDVQRSVFLDLIRSHPEMTLAELSKLSKGQFSGLLSSVTVGEVINAAHGYEDATPMKPSPSGSSRASNSSSLSSSSSSSSLSPVSSASSRSDLSDFDDDTESSEEVNTRTAAGRREYDQRVLELIREASDPVSATEIRNHVGGTSLQVRKAVARLIESEQVTWQGKARGTRYSAL